MNLLIDIGNTRIKWALHDANSLRTADASPHAGWTADEIIRHILNNMTRPDRVWVANVAGATIQSQLNQALHRHFGLSAHYARSTAECAGVRNGYQHVEQLGVDRWLGVIAAHHMTQACACVVNVGTAMTVDAVDAQGRHLGGSIVPGLNLMVDTLLNQTGEIAKRAALAPFAALASDNLFADNTQAAIHQGARHALAALVERAVSHLAHRTGQAPQLILTGGASEQIQSLLQTPSMTIPDLVLRGLAIVSANDAERQT